MHYWLKKKKKRQEVGKAVSTFSQGWLLRKLTALSAVTVIYAGEFLINMTAVFRLN